MVRPRLASPAMPRTTGFRPLRTLAFAAILGASIASGCNSDDATGPDAGLSYRLADVDGESLPFLIGRVSTFEGIRDTYVVGATVTLTTDSLWLLVADLRDTGGGEATRNYVVRDTARYTVE